MERTQYYFMKLKLSFFLFLSLSVVSASAMAQEMVIFSFNKDFATLSSGKAKMLFRGKLKRLNKQKYLLIDWPTGSTTKVDFYQSLLGMSESKVNASRAKMVFSGKGFPPKVIESDNYLTLKTYLKTIQIPLVMPIVQMFQVSFIFYTLFRRGNNR